MSIVSQVGQMIMVEIDGDNVTDSVRMMIQRYHVGNIFISRRNIKGTIRQSYYSLKDIYDAN